MKESGTAARIAREVFSVVSSEEVLSKIKPPAQAMIEDQVGRLEDRIDDAYLLLRVIVALQVASLGAIFMLAF